MFSFLILGHVCPQPMEMSKMIHEGLSVPEVTSEDCLFLNVYAPATANSDSRLPVMVWIHGGAFTVGRSLTANILLLIENVLKFSDICI